MDGHCAKHVFEPTESTCRTCGGEYCRECLVYAYGAKKPPYCVSCALSAAGVRSTAARPQVRSKREIKREMKERKRAEKVASKVKAHPNDIAADLFDAQPLGAGAPPPPSDAGWDAIVPTYGTPVEAETEPVTTVEAQAEAPFSMNNTSGVPQTESVS